MLSPQGEPLVEIDYQEVQWVTNYYDGPLGGIVRMPNGEIGLFSFDSDSDEWPPQYYYVYELTQEERSIFTLREKLWKRYGEKGQHKQWEKALRAAGLPQDATQFELDIIKSREPVAYIL